MAAKGKLFSRKAKSTIKRGRNYGKEGSYGEVEKGRKRWDGKGEIEKMRCAEKKDNSKR